MPQVNLRRDIQVPLDNGVKVRLKTGWQEVEQFIADHWLVKSNSVPEGGDPTPDPAPTSFPSDLNDDQLRDFIAAMSDTQRTVLFEALETTQPGGSDNSGGDSAKRSRHSPANADAPSGNEEAAIRTGEKAQSGPSDVAGKPGVGPNVKPDAEADKADRKDK